MIGFWSLDDSFIECVVWVIFWVFWVGYSFIGYVFYSGIIISVCKEKIFFVLREMKWCILIS